VLERFDERDGGRLTRVWAMYRVFAEEESGLHKIAV
jgi:hypothetical protein